MPDWREAVWVASPLKGIHLRDSSEVQLNANVALVAEDTRLLSARTDLGMFLSKVQSEDLSKARWFLAKRIRRSAATLEAFDIPREVERLQDALMAFQIVKPIETYGLIFHGTEFSDGRISWLGITDRRWPMSAGQWSELRTFDEPMLNEARSMIPRVESAMAGPEISKKNAIHLLQLALEHPHPYVAALLAVTGIEAILDSQDRWDFESKLCSLLGASTLAFPDWNSPEFPPLSYTVKALAVHLYTLRSKVAHGGDLTKAAYDKNAPVDLLALKDYIPQTEPVRYAMLLGEASIYLLAQVLRRVL